MGRDERRSGRDKLLNLSRMRDRFRRVDPRYRLYAISRRVSRFRVSQFRISRKIHVPNRTGPRQSLARPQRLAPPHRKSG